MNGNLFAEERRSSRRREWSPLLPAWTGIIVPALLLEEIELVFALGTPDNIFHALVTFQWRTGLNRLGHGRKGRDTNAYGCRYVKYKIRDKTECVFFILSFSGASMTAPSGRERRERS